MRAAIETMFRPLAVATPWTTPSPCLTPFVACVISREDD
jgi:hypothetical protein